MGELLLALPALRRAAELAPGRLLVQVVAGLTPVLAMAGLQAEVLPLPDRHRLLGAASAVRRRRPRRAVLLSPSLSAALLVRLAGVPERRGTATDGRSWLLTERVDRAPLLRGHRVLEYLALVDPESADREPPRPRLERREAARLAWRSVAGEAGVEASVPASGSTVRIGLVPGSAASSRRWPAERFAALARRRLVAGEEVIVFGGEREVGLTARIAREAPGAVDLGGRTGLAALAGGLESCGAVVASDTGPMHLAAALDRPVVAIFGAGDPRQTRPLAGRALVVSRGDLPCVPCLRNRCPRKGRGFQLPQARLECLRLVTVDDVEEALLSVRGELPGRTIEGAVR